MVPAQIQGSACIFAVILTLKLPKSMRKVDRHLSYGVFMGPSSNPSNGSGNQPITLVLLGPRQKVTLPCKKAANSPSLTLRTDQIDYGTACSGLAFLNKAIPYWKKVKQRFKTPDNHPDYDSSIQELLQSLDNMLADGLGLQQVLQARADDLIAEQNKSKKLNDSSNS